MTRHALRAAVLTAVFSVLSSSGTTFAKDRRAFAIEDLYRLKSPSNLAIAPEGGWLVYDLRSTDLGRGTSNKDLYAVTSGGRDSRRLTWTDKFSESGPVFSPDGKRIAFVAQRDDQEHEQVWLLPARGGEARSLTDISTGVADLLWSPDGRYIAFTSEVYPECGDDDECNKAKTEKRENGPLDAHLADELLYRHWNFWSDGKVQHILLVDVESGEIRDLTPGEREAPKYWVGRPRGYAFSPDGKELCYTRNPDPIDSLAWSTNADLWIVPLEPGADGKTPEAVNITSDNAAWDGSPRYSPDGRYIAYRRQAQPGFESDLMRLGLYDRKTGETRVLTSEFDNWIESFAWLSDATGLVFSAAFEGRNPLYRVSVPGGTLRRVADFATIDEFVLSPDGRHAYALRRSIESPSELWKLDLGGKDRPKRLTVHNRRVEEEVDLRPAETLWVEGADGARIQVFLVKPHGFDPARKYPLILNVHGGPQGMWADSFRGDWQVYPGAGYVVAFPNPHGSTGFGQAFTAQISGDWGGKVFEDLMKVTDALERLPYVDGDRMGAMGWSYGGYMMNWFQGHTSRFKALACMMGLFDLRSFYLTTEELWFPEWDLGGMPWNSALYERWNPANAVEAFQTPELFITGEKDFRVPYTQSLMGFTALRRRGIPARLIVLPDAGHWPGWYEMALYYTAHLDWFHRYLEGDPPPWSVEEFAGNAVFDPKTGQRLQP